MTPWNGNKIIDCNRVVIIWDLKSHLKDFLKLQTWFFYNLYELCISYITEIGKKDKNVSHIQDLCDFKMDKNVVFFKEFVVSSMKKSRIQLIVIVNVYVCYSDYRVLYIKSEKSMLTYWFQKEMEVENHYFLEIIISK